LVARTDRHRKEPLLRARRVRRLSAVARPQPPRERLALVAGLVVSLALAAVTLGGVLLAGGVSPASAPVRAAGGFLTAGAPQAPAPTGGDLTSVRRMRAIVLTQLRRAQRLLRPCGAPASIARSRIALADWRHCARWPLARLGMDGRMDGGILSTLGGHLPAGGCREAVLGRANGMALIGAEAEAVVHGLWDVSPGGRAETAQGAASVAGLIGAMRRAWRGSPLRLCHPVL
jgi:hypothetical protein